MKKYNYKLENLDCAACAQKIEDTLKKVSDYQNVSVNFNTQKLSLSSSKEVSIDVIQKYVSKVESDVKVTDYNLTSDKIKDNSIYPIVRLIVGILFGVLSSIFSNNAMISVILMILAYCVLLYRSFLSAIKLLIKSHSMNENFLVTISCIGAFLVNERMEGLMVIVLYEIGKILEEKAVSKSRNSIKELMNIRPEYANLLVNGEVRVVSPSEVELGSHILVKKGEKVPVDGIIIKGSTSFDVAALTGESVPQNKEISESVLSGSINLGEVIELEVTALYEDSTVQRILNLVENATDKKAKTETFVSKAARIYTPIILGLSILTALIMIFIFKVSVDKSIYQALIFLVISCPCAIAISIPLSYFSGIGRASKSGVLIKGSDYLEALSSVEKVVCDKTGTITTGKFEVSEIISLSSYSEEEILDFISKGEYFSNHPIALSILKKQGKVDISRVKDPEEISGKGVSYYYQNHHYLVGNANFVSYTEKETSSLAIVYLKEDETILGKVTLEDSIKDSAYYLVNELKKEDILVHILTGDTKLHAKKVADKLSISSFDAELLPEDKYKILENMIRNKQNSSKKIAFIGDGINDAPVLALSDLGISMGGVGSSSAIEASDVVIMNDDLSKVVEAISISKKTNRIIKQNLVFAIGTKLLVLSMSFFGIAGMWQAIFADVGVTLLTILNTLRILKK